MRSKPWAEGLSLDRHKVSEVTIWWRVSISFPRSGNGVWWRRMDGSMDEWMDMIGWSFEFTSIYSCKWSGVGSRKRRLERGSIFVWRCPIIIPREKLKSVGNASGVMNEILPMWPCLTLKLQHLQVLVGISWIEEVDEDRALKKRSHSKVKFSKGQVY